MLRYIIMASVPMAFVAFAGTASAQSALSSCDPVTGLSANGSPCVELTPVDPGNIATPTGAAGGEQYDRLDTTTLGQTYECRTTDRANRQTGAGGALLIEDCGTPFGPGELGQLKPFYGTTGAPAPLPAPPAAPAPVIAAAPAAPVAAPPAFAPVTGVSAAGLGSTVLPFALIGAAGLVGVIALAASDDDDDNTTTTTTN